MPKDTVGAVAGASWCVRPLVSIPTSILVALATRLTTELVFGRRSRQRSVDGG